MNISEGNTQSATPAAVLAVPASEPHPLAGAELMAGVPDDDGAWLYRLRSGDVVAYRLVVEPSFMAVAA